jgi:hypothetical protein
VASAAGVLPLKDRAPPVTPSPVPVTAPRPAPGLWIALAAIALSAIALPLLAVLFAPPPPASPVLAEIARPKRVVPAAELPEVEPVRLAALSMDDARAFNAAIPFSTDPNPAARPLILDAGAEDFGRAVDCLAAATWYEAGDDPVGQRAVAQVVLNRMRHPAFPKSVCGVVFQGQERRTGCQFTFTCDGAMRRSPSPVAWGRAQTIARQALTGSVFAKVGHSTHYHTDWVVPYWSSSLDKVAEVNTHLFFRWTGWWGTPPAFRRGYAGVEPVVAKMAALSPFHGGGEVALAGAADPAAMLDPDVIPESAVPKPVATGGDSFHVALDKAMGADAFAALAIRTCGERAYCKFLGWTDRTKVPAVGASLTPAQIEAMSFSYLRDKEMGFGKALWNCGEFKRPSPIQCMRRTPVAAAVAPAPVPSATPEVLSGVRRKPAPSPTPSPTPAIN